MEKQTGKNNIASKLFLLPRRYRLIGKIITLISIIGIAVEVSDRIGIVLPGDANRYNPVLITFYITLILGLFAIAWTREKIEDEFTVRWRLLAMGISFIAAILTVIGFPLFFMITGGKAFHLNATYVVIEMLVVYLACYNIFKGFYKEE